MLRPLSLIVLLALCASLAAVDSLEIEVVTQPSDVSLSTYADYTVVSLPDGIDPDAQPGLPLVPCRSIQVAIPTGHRVVGVSGTGATEILAEDLVLLPTQPPHPLSEPAPALVGPDAAAYAADDPFPATVATQAASGRLRGHSLLSVRVNPLQYIAATGTLQLRRSVRVTVQLEAVIQPTSAVGGDSGALADLARGLVVNPKAIAEPLRTESTDDVSYLIITEDSLVSTFERLATHRASAIGGSHSTAIITVETIATTYDGTRPDGGSDLQTKIRNCIADYVNNHATEYVVLGGSSGVVPDRDCKVHVGKYDEDKMPTDLYYADCLDGTWDTDGDGSYGEASDDDVDLYPDVILGRIVTNDASQSNAYIDKLIDFETNLGSYDDLFGRHYLMGGKKLWDNVTPTDTCDDGHPQFTERDGNVSDCEQWSRRVFRDEIQPNWTPDTILCLFDTMTTWDPTGSSTVGDYDASGNHFVDQVNANGGVGLVWIDTHGGSGVLAMEGNSIGKGDARDLTAPIGVLYTGACLSGRFDDKDSLSEEMIRNGDGGPLAYFGSSRYGWGSPGTYYGGASGLYYRRYVEEMFQNSHATVGSLFSAHKVQRISSCGYNGAPRWIQFGLNHQGDPAVPVIGVKPVVSVAATDHLAAEPGSDTATLVFTRTTDAGDLDATYSIGGSTGSGDYNETLSGTVAFADGERQIVVTITPSDDSDDEGDEDLVITLQDGDGYRIGAASATVTIVDDDSSGPAVVSLEAVTGITGEIRDPARLRFTRTGSITGDLTVSCTLSGSAGTDDIVEDLETVTLPAGVLEHEIDITPVDDELIEGVEGLVVSLVDNGAYDLGEPYAAELTIHDDDARLTLSATTSTAHEGGDDATLRISRAGGLDGDIEARLAFIASESSAEAGDVSFAGTVTMPAGSATRDVAITAVDDSDYEAEETAVIALAADAAYAIGTDDRDAITIPANDNAAPVVDAGENQTLQVLTTTLAGSVSDDGNPPPASLSVAWSTLSGPGSVDFDDPNDPTTAVAFDTYGTYLLELSADDGELTTTDSVRIDVRQPLSATASANVTNGGAPLAVQFTGSATGGNPLTAQPGLQAEFYYLAASPNAVPDFSVLSPDLVRVDDQVNYPSTDAPWTGLAQSDDFACRHTGQLIADGSGEYTISLESDDGSLLWLDDELLIDNDGNHAMDEVSTTLHLEAGAHDIEIGYIEAGGGAGLILRWTPPGGSQQVVPAANLQHDAPADGAPPADGVVHLAFDDASGDTAIDACGGDHAGALSGDADWRSDGKRGGAVHVAGSGLVALADSDAINTADHDLRSVLFWFQADDASASQVLYEEGGSVNGANVYLHDGQLYVGAWTDGSFAAFLSTAAPTDGAWHHVAFVLDAAAGTFTGYLDGEAFATDTSAATLASHSDDTGIGDINGDSLFHADISPGGFSGAIDDFALYNQALSADVIAAVVTPPTPYTYEWDFDGDGITDATGAEVIHAFDNDGSYTVTLTVSDGTTTATDTVLITVGAGGPRTTTLTVRESDSATVTCEITCNGTTMLSIDATTTEAVFSGLADDADSTFEFLEVPTAAQ